MVLVLLDPRNLQAVSCQVEELTFSSQAGQNQSEVQRLLHSRRPHLGLVLVLVLVDPPG